MSPSNDAESPFVTVGIERSESIRSPRGSSLNIHLGEYYARFPR
jgi:hypothetical protein